MKFLITSNVASSYFEFGTHRARTFTMVMGLDDFYALNMGATVGGLMPKPDGGFMDRYFAFDSFEGWPADTDFPDLPYLVAGGAKTTEKDFLKLLMNYGQSTERVELIAGFCQKSSNNSLTTRFVKENVKASLITVECNLYEAYKSVFNWVDKCMQPGTVLYLDDLHSHKASPSTGPRLAWSEYREQTSWKFEPFLPIASCGYSFISYKVPTSKEATLRSSTLNEILLGK